MAIKRKISKADFEALADDRKELYKENPSRRGEYILDMDDPDNELVSALDKAKQDKKELETKLAELETKLTDLEDKGKKPTGKLADDMEALRVSYEKKLSDAAAAMAALEAGKNGQIKKLLADTKATELASKISKVPKLMSRVIRDRLDVDLSGDEPRLTVLDADGKPSAFSLSDLEQEIVANADYADIIIASKASGGNSGHGGGSGNATNQDGKPLQLANLPPDQLRAHIASKVAKD